MDPEVNKIVNIILNKNFTTMQLWYGKKSISQRLLDEDIVEPNKEFKGILTDLIVNYFTDLSFQTELFLKTIVQVFEEAINKYKTVKNLSSKSIIFVYKGGNVLRIMANASENRFPGLVSEELKKFYGDSFKKSDADFTIYIDPKLANFEEIFNDMTNMTFLLENHLRNIFMSHLDEYFQFYRLNINERKELMLSQLKKLNESETVKNKLYGYNGHFDALGFGNLIVSNDNSQDYETKLKEDFEIGFESREAPPGIKYVYNTNLRHIHTLTPGDPAYEPLKLLIPYQQNIYKNKPLSEIFVSVNKTTIFRKKKVVLSFNLVRTKFSFNVFFTYENGDTKNIKLDGELIDVSIINKDYTTLSHFYEHVDDYVTTYEIGSGDTKFTFKGYTIEYMISDLEFILFSVSQYPWEDLKYAKRIKRLLYLYFIMLLINNKFNNQDRFEYINNIDIILNKIEEYLKTNNENFRIQALDLIKNYIISLKNSNGYVRENPFGNLIKKLGMILISSNVDKAAFLKFIQIIKENTEIMKKSLKGIVNYIRNNGSIIEGSIYKADKLGGNKGVV